jgi:hypothetical protein
MCQMWRPLALSRLEVRALQVATGLGMIRWSNFARVVGDGNFAGQPLTSGGGGRSGESWIR